MLVLPEDIIEIIHAAKDMGEDLVKFIQIALIFDKGGAREIIESVQTIMCHALIHAFNQREIFPYCHRNFGGAKFCKETLKHGQCFTQS